MDENIVTGNENAISMAEQALESEAPDMMLSLAVKPIPRLRALLVEARKQGSSPGIESDLRRCEAILATAIERGVI